MVRMSGDDIHTTQGLILNLLEINLLMLQISSSNFKLFVFISQEYLTPDILVLMFAKYFTKSSNKIHLKCLRILFL